MKRHCHALLFLYFVAFLIFTPPIHGAQASSGTLINVWCNITNFFGFACDTQGEIITPAPAPEVSVANPPPLPIPTDDYQIVNAVSEAPIQNNTTVVEEHNTYITNPTTVVYQTTSTDTVSNSTLLDLIHKLITIVDESKNQSGSVPRDLFNKQIDQVFDSSGESRDDLEEDMDTRFASLSSAITTDLLTVTGNIDVSAGSAYTYNGANVITASTTLNNYFFGGAGNLTMTGAGNTGSGYQALLANTTGNYSTAVGMQSLFSNTTGLNNTAVGYQALYSNTTGTNNTANGHLALRNSTTGANNTAYGFYSLYYNTTGSNNTASGINSLLNNTTGSGNTASGYQNLALNTTGSNNTAYGYQALFANTTGANNTALGYNAGRYAGGSVNNSTTSNSVFLGYDTRSLTANDTNQIVIGYQAIGNGSNSVTLGNTSITKTILQGNVGIGTTTPNNLLQVYDLIDFNNTDFNSKLGYQAGKNIVSGAQSNTFLGYQAGYSSSTGSTNAADYNTAIGYHSLFSNTTGSANTANGVHSLYSNTTGSSNNANGFQSLTFNTTGSNNTANGYRSMYYNTTGSDNTASGRESLLTNTSGTQNTAYGRSSLILNTTGSYNTANGSYALSSNTTGSYNTALGSSAGYDINTATSTGANTLIGYNTGRGIVTGTNNTILGANVTGLSSTLSNNIIIADGSGNQRISVGSTGNVELGLKDSNAATTTSKLAVYDGDIKLGRFIYGGAQSLGSVLFETRDNSGSRIRGEHDFDEFGEINSAGIAFDYWANGFIEGMRLTAGGRLGIGTTTPSAKLTVTQSAQTATGGLWLSTSDNTDFRSQYMNTSGVLSFYGGDTVGTLNTATLNAAGEWTNASDISYKENIEKLSYGLDTVLALQPRSYDIKNTNNHRIGFIAQEVEEVIPEVVSGEDGSKGISYGNLVAVAISAIQELAGKVNGFAESITTKFMKAEQVETNTLCLEGLCITKSQLQEMLNNQTSNASEPSPTPSTPEISEDTDTTDDNSTTTSQVSEEVKPETPEQTNESEEVIVEEEVLETEDVSVSETPAEEVAL